MGLLWLIIGPCRGIRTGLTKSTDHPSSRMSACRFNDLGLLGAPCRSHGYFTFRELNTKPDNAAPLHASFRAGLRLAQGARTGLRCGSVAQPPVRRSCMPKASNGMTSSGRLPGWICAACRDRGPCTLQVSAYVGLKGILVIIKSSSCSARQVVQLSFYTYQARTCL